MAKTKVTDDTSGRRWIKNVTRDEMNAYIRQGYYVGWPLYAKGELHPPREIDPRTGNLQDDNVGIYADEAA